MPISVKSDGIRRGRKAKVRHGQHRRQWVIHAAMGQVWFLLCTGFIMFFSFVCDQMQTSTRPDHGQDFESSNL